QLAVEGGWLMSIPVVIALLSGMLQIGSRLRADRSPIFWIRVGAASGVMAIAVQNIWDTGLRMPANAVLFALAAAVALHEPDGSGEKPAGAPLVTQLAPRAMRSPGSREQGKREEQPVIEMVRSRSGAKRPRARSD